MLSAKRVLVGTILILLLATSAVASNFRAADLVYFPAAGNPGTFRTDVVVTNVSSTDRVIVTVCYGPTGNVDNTNMTTNANCRDLQVLVPGERREIVNITGSIFGFGSSFGHLLFFACREGGSCSDCDTNPAACSLITVEGRIYSTNATTGGTTGQLFSGIPWYNYASIRSADIGLDKVFIVGIRQNASFRSNLGFLNASQNSIANLRVTLFSGTGTQLGQVPIDLLPLGHRQLNITDPALFPGFTGTGAWIQVQQIGPTTGDPAAGFLAYGSVLDNITNDPTTLEAQYFTELEWTCIYGAKPERRPAKRR